jgi:ferric-dicitrate binding protein FerR (iron transport regulator)
MQNMNEPRVFILLGKKLSNEATAEELAELERLLEDQSVEPYELELLQDVWQKKTGTDATLSDERWEKIADRLRDQPGLVYEYIPNQEKKKTVFYAGRMLAAASVVALLFLTVWLVWRRQEEKASPVAVSGVKDSVVVALNGERKKVVLPDSTTVHLNSGSRLSYNKDFGKGNRQVWLNGEAFFEVTKDAAHPFLVNTDRMTVKVLGTVFNVKAYNTKEDIETTVVEGKVEVSLKEGAEKKVILLPSEKISLKNNRIIKDGAVPQAVHPGISYEVKTVQPDIKETGMPEEAAWVKEKVIFTDEPFETVALKMERWYNVHILFKNGKMKSILMNGDFDNVNINEAMHILQMMVGFKYTIRNNDIFIE